ncbi:O-methyltransferase [Tumebacillus permanentifrigoris]|uniref:Putative O-methyltransferase YrrM n=1 Tax=Tumebacillus permanentifrigoris TaxID=378543 RepID=A0A316D7I8_9BACL|nr:O-methyltransferase [Tumebacillus permanentifrigoris]PWK08444.1 putative O-methyltransferase YrrM [Tumebacillus permanentifrigoris]
MNTSREQYVREVFVREDETLLAVRQSIRDADMPSISVASEVGKLLSLVVQMTGAKRALEIGALGGYSGIVLARALPADGELVSLELLPEYATFAHENLKKAGLGDKVQYRTGEALDSLQKLHEEGQRFDVFFIDADKVNYSNYLDWAIRLANPGAVITADNVLQGDRIFDEGEQGESVVAIRAFNQKVASDDRLESLLLPFGDGLVIARVK